MMVYASNQPSQFDGAVMDRIDEMVEFTLLQAHERKKMLGMYIERYLSGTAGGGDEEGEDRGDRGGGD